MTSVKLSSDSWKYSIARRLMPGLGRGCVLSLCASAAAVLAACSTIEQQPNLTGESLGAPVTQARPTPPTGNQALVQVEQLAPSQAPQPQQTVAQPLATDAPLTLQQALELGLITPEQARSVNFANPAQAQGFQQAPAGVTGAPGVQVASLTPPVGAPQPLPNGQFGAGPGTTSGGFGTVVSSRVVGTGSQRITAPVNTPTTQNASPSPASSQANQANFQPSGPPPDESPTSFGISNLRFNNFVVPGANFSQGPVSLRDSGSVPCALTFDDGPHPQLDPQVLDILKSKGVRATFFYLGQLINANPQIVQRAMAEGHEIGQHSFDHSDMSKLSRGRIESQLDRTSQALQAIGIQSQYFRPPYGAYNSTVLEEARERGLRTVNWTNDSEDWKASSPTQVTNRVMSSAEPGDIILLHSIQRPTVAALPTLIDRLATKGCQFVTVSEWLRRVEG